MRLVPLNLPSLQMLCAQARPDEIEQYEAMTGVKWDRDNAAIDYFTRRGEAFLLLTDDGEPVAAAGWERLRPGVWQGWMVGTMDQWGSHWLSITKFARRVMDDMLESGERRLQICCLQSRQQAREWYVKGLKMEHNGDLPQFGVNGETACIYARVRAD